MMNNNDSEQNIISNLIRSDKLFIKRISKYALKFAIFKSLLAFLDVTFSSSAFQSFIHFIAAVLAGFFSFKYDVTVSSYVVNWIFVIPFSLIYLTVLWIFSKLNKKKNNHETHTDKHMQLTERINYNLHEISVMQQTVSIDGINNVLDVISQNICRAIHDILCNYYSLNCFKVTIIKRSFDDESIKMNAFYSSLDKIPDLYGITIPITEKTNYDDMSFVKVFTQNLEDGIVLKNEHECIEYLSPNGKHRINTKQFISIPGIVGNKVVVLLQIASKQENVFTNDDFILIAKTITPIFVQELCNLHMMEKRNNELEQKLKGV